MSLTVIRAGAPIAETPVGAIQGYAGSSAPAGWLLCDGTAVSRTSYAELFGVIGTTYGSGDGSTTFNLPNTTGYIIYATRLATRVQVNNPPQYVTSLPASPTDGQEVYYAADATNGVIWHLRYRGSSSSSYKWEYVGGAPLGSGTSIDENTSAGTVLTSSYASLQSITLPVSGTWNVEYSIGFTAAPGSSGSYASIYYDGSIVSSTVSYAAHSEKTTYYRMHQADYLTGKAVALYVKSDNGNSGCKYFSRYLTITPVRVG